jgi:ribosomal protein S18 acetylase RimI-like enzyme
LDSAGKQVISLALNIVELDDRLEGRFWDHVNRSPLDHYWFILDWRFQRPDTRIFMAMEDELIEGMMLIFENAVVQLRGSREAVKALLGRLDAKTVELTAPVDCRDIVSQHYKDPAAYELMLMHMEKGQERPQISHKPERLLSGDSEGVARVVMEANYEWWDDVTAERVRKSFEKNLWVGIKRDGRVVAVGGARYEEIGCNIGIVATDEAYRNQGFATSIVSALVKEIFRTHTKALIHVLTTNKPAVHVYSKVGFRPYRSFFMIRKGERVSENQS